VTATLSVAAVQFAVTEVAATSLNVGAPGTPGAVVSVVWNAALLKLPKLSAASRARTRTVYVVPLVRPVMETPELAFTHVAPPLIEYW
jgi:hypothetical protein